MIMRKLLIFVLICFSCNQLKAEELADTANVNFNINCDKIAYIRLKYICLTLMEDNYDVIYGEPEYPENSLVASKAGNCYLVNWLTGDEKCLGSLDSSEVQNLISTMQKGKVRIIVQK